MALVKKPPVPLVIPQRATFRQRLKLTNTSGQPAFTEAYDFVAQFWDSAEKRRTLYATFEVNILDAADGWIELYLPFEVTRTLTKAGEWDLLVIKPDGDRVFWLEGPVTIDFNASDTE